VRLSGLDHAFLHFETPAAYMHVALTGVFEAGSLARPDGGIEIERIRAHVASAAPPAAALQAAAALRAAHQ